MKNTQIKQVETKLHAVPLAEVLSDAKHGDHTHFELVTVTARACEMGANLIDTGGL